MKTKMRKGTTSRSVKLHSETYSEKNNKVKSCASTGSHPEPTEWRTGTGGRQNTAQESGETPCA